MMKILILKYQYIIQSSKYIFELDYGLNLIIFNKINIYRIIHIYQLIICLIFIEPGQIIIFFLKLIIFKTNFNFKVRMLNFFYDE